MMARHIYIISIYFTILAFIETKRYRVTPISSTKCKAPTDNVDPTAPVTYTTGVRAMNKHTKVVRTNFTVSRPAGPIKMSVKINHLKQASKDEIFKIENVDCHNPITYQLFRLINLNLTNDCIVMPGNYLTENINPQDFSWILTKAMVSPGRYEYLLQFYTEKGLAACNSIICDIKELK